MELSFVETEVFKDMLEDPFALVAEEIYPMVPTYLSRRESDINRLRQFLETRDFAGIKFVGHQLKGNGTGYGFPVISKIGQELESAASDQNWDKMSEFIEHLESSIRYLKSHFVV
jgi:HPt (histidine-containing phosphotransfer) domain-containing protein